MFYTQRFQLPFYDCKMVVAWLDYVDKVRQVFPAFLWRGKNVSWEFIKIVECEEVVFLVRYYYERVNYTLEKFKRFRAF